MQERTSRAPVVVLGLGGLGSALAGAFLAAGHPTTVWNRSPEKADDLVARGASRAASVDDAVAAGALVVVCVSDYAAVHAVVGPADDRWSGRALVNLTSGTPADARDLAAWAADGGVGYLDGAAMSGTRKVGQPDALFLFSGANAGFTAHRATLAALGDARWLGAEPGLAALYDTALFGMAWGALAGFQHAVALLGSEGVAASAASAVAVGHLPFVGELMAEHARQLDEGKFPADDGSIAVHAAAMDHLIATSRAQHVDAGLPELIRSMLDRATAAGHGADGIAAVGRVLR